MVPSRSYYCTDTECFYGDGDSDDDEEFFEVDDETEPPTTPSESESSDFDLYLSSFAGDGWMIDEIVGGVANRTIRATRAKNDGSNKALNGRSSVVLKYAPPFLYKCPELKFDQYRQVCSCHSLSRFASCNMMKHLDCRSYGASCSA